MPATRRSTSAASADNRRGVQSQGYMLFWAANAKCTAPPAIHHPLHDPRQKATCYVDGLSSVQGMAEF